MGEREVSFDFDKIKKTKVEKTTAKDLEVGTAVLKLIADQGEQVGFVEGSDFGKKFPNKFDLKGGVTAEFMPHWGYVGFQRGEERELFDLHTSRLPKEQIVKSVKERIKELKQK